MLENRVLLDIFQGSPVLNDIVRLRSTPTTWFAELSAIPHFNVNFYSRNKKRNIGSLEAANKFVKRRRESRGRKFVGRIRPGSEGFRKQSRTQKKARLFLPIRKITHICGSKDRQGQRFEQPCKQPPAGIHE